jgi:hypothetical protein
VIFIHQKMKIYPLKATNQNVIQSLVSEAKPRCASPASNSGTSESDSDSSVESIRSYSCDWKEITEVSNIEAQLPFCYTKTKGPEIN